jgi:UDP-N-acetylmuramyl tripeptide synthase
MIRLQLIFWIWLGNSLAFVSRTLGKGSGTSLPGLLVEKYNPSLLKTLTEDLQEIICLSGTNGKTTTRALLVHLYESENIAVVSNRGGANIIRGLAASLLLNRDWLGRPLSKVGIFEVEEASLPIFAKYVWINKLILTNVFRDQLDAYGEIDKTSDYFRQTIELMGGQKRELSNKDLQSLPKNYLKPNKKTNREFVVYLNQDDGMLVDLLRTHSFEAVGFGVKDKNLPTYEKSVDKRLLPLLSQKYIASEVKFKSLNSMFAVKSEVYPKVYINSQLPGLYNVYNILAAFVLAFQRFGSQIAGEIDSFAPVFGRGEKIQFGGKQVSLFLVKNPAGFDQVLGLLAENFANQKINLSICVNDNIADGKDVSWLWDISLEKYLPELSIKSLKTSGSRGLDMLLRFQYAGLQLKPSNYCAKLSDLADKLEGSNQEQVVLCTYTALLELRKIVSDKVELSSINSKGN